MARRKQMKRRVEGWKTKSWYNIYAPDIFDKAYIGNTVANDPEMLVGRVMQTTLGEMTNDYSRQHIKMRFKVRDVAGDAGYTNFIGHEVTRDYLRSLVKRRTSRIDTLVLVTSKDGKKLRVTTSCFTISRANLAQAHAIRKTVEEFMVAKAAEMEYDHLAKYIVIGEAARDLFKVIKTIYPTRRVEVIKTKGQEIKE
jgi:small subunit ribosomal protein S3Ae